MSKGYTLDQICERISSTRFRWTCEKDLQDGIEQVLQAMALPYTREHRLGPKDIIDFLVVDGLGIEVKVKGTIMDLMRQLGRYSAFPEVTALIVVTGRVQLSGIKPTIGGKPVRIISLLGSLL